MINHEQRNPSSSGRENHHICSTCGWTYPNPHPSAKLRRTHKKICGKPQGFKPIDSDDRTHSGLSDDEQQQQQQEQHYSDDDRQTPLVEVPKSDDRLGSGGVRERRNRSEDESFSDAVTEFSDTVSSPGDSEKNAKRTLEGDLDSSSLLKDDAKSGSTELLSTSIDNNEVKDLEVFERPDARVGESNTEDTTKLDEDEVLANVSEHPSRNLNESFEAVIKAQETDGNTSTPLREDGVVQLEQVQGGTALLKSNLPLEVESIHQNEEYSVENVDVSNHSGLEVLANTKTEGQDVHILSVAEDIPLIGDSDILIEDFKDHHAVRSYIPPTLDSAEVLSPMGDSEKDEDDKDNSIPNMNYLEDSVNSALVEEDFAKDTDVGHGDLIENSNSKGEGEEAVSVLSVAEDLSVAEYQIEDFKDHEVLKSEIPLVVGSTDLVMSLGDGDKVPEDMISSSALRFDQTTSLPGGDDTSKQEMFIDEISDVHPNENAEVPEAVKCAGETNQNHESDNQCLETTSVEIIPFSADVDIDASNSRDMIQNLPSTPKCADEDAPEVVKETKIKNDSEVVECVDPVAVGSHLNDRVDAEVSERMSDEPVLKEQKCTDEVSQAVVQETKIDNDGEVVECVSPVDLVSELNDRVDAEVSEEPILKEQKCLDEDHQEIVKETKAVNDNEVVQETKIDNDGEVVECVSPVDMVSELNDRVYAEVSERMSEEPVLKEQKCLDEDHQEIIKETKAVNDNEVVDWVHPVATGTELNDRVDAEVSQRMLEESILKEQKCLGDDSQDVIKETKMVNDAKVYAGIISEPMQEKGNDKPHKEHSTVDMSADLSSQNSLDANWGSVSVLSTQSDRQASVDVETSEKANSGKSENVSDEHQLDQSDVFEPPSFMTLVERGGGVDKNDDSSTVKGEQNYQLPKPESLTNVSIEPKERRKSEELIAKVTNWSPGKHQSTRLKSLLGEVDTESKQKSSNSKHPKDETTAENNLTTTVKSVLSTEDPAADRSAKREAGKEWSSPARYPGGSKKDRKKVKGKPSWVPFVCCSSVNVN